MTTNIDTMEQIDELQQQYHKNPEYEAKKGSIAAIFREITKAYQLGDSWKPLFDRIIGTYTENEDYAQGFSDAIKFFKYVLDGGHK